MKKPRVQYLNPAEWTGSVAAALTYFAVQKYHTHTPYSIMLTGGRSAESMYRTWAARPEFGRLRNVQFYFSDERCVPPDHPESNYGLAMRTLFQHGVPYSCEVIRILAELPDHDAAATAYEAKLPERLDALLLSVGEDGHIASLFPHSSALLETRRRVVYVNTPKPPVERITVTPGVITQAHHVFVMALGQIKADLYKQAQIDPHNIASLPARLVLNATWFLDTQSTI